MEESRSFIAIVSDGAITASLRPGMVCSTRAHRLLPHLAFCTENNGENNKGWHLSEKSILLVSLILMISANVLQSSLHDIH